MSLNKSKGNMYDWVSHTWNVIKGKCPHGCIYCYMKDLVKKDMYFDNSELLTDLGSGNLIFVGSSFDMWCNEVDDRNIELILDKCRKYDNVYLFQSKNPARFLDFHYALPRLTILGTTIETNYNYFKISKAPPPIERAIKLSLLYTNRKMVSIEPILDFDIETMIEWIKDINPEFVSIGADSKHTRELPEPPREKIVELYKKLNVITNVKLKRNLMRLM